MTAIIKYEVILSIKQLLNSFLLFLSITFHEMCYPLHNPLNISTFCFFSITKYIIKSLIYVTYVSKSTKEDKKHKKDFLSFV